MIMRALIIDDEPLAHKVILEYVKDVPFVEVIGQYYTGTEALAALSDPAVDLIFLDIHMPRLKGLDLLRVVKSPPLVIITSAHEEYALAGFELDVCDYLLKPFRLERFLKAVNKAYERYRLQQADRAATTHEPPVAAPAPPERIFIKSDKRHIQLELAEVYYLESYGNYVKFWLEDHFHLTPGTLSGFEQQLPPGDFLRIHKSYIIHRRYIDYAEGNSVVMKNQQRLPIGKSYRAGFREFIG